MLYDYMMFFNENDILDVRLHEHDSVVDKFIIVEAGQSHAGDSKPFFFDSDRFEKFKDKIIYIQIPSLDEAITKHPEISALSKHSSNAKLNYAWVREEFHTNYCYTILQDIGARDEDMIMWGGLDEIISEQGLKKGLEIIGQSKSSMVTFEWELRCYKLNLFAHLGHGTHMAKLEEWKKCPLSIVRQRDIYTHCVQEPKPVGWHLSFMSKTPSNLVKKYKSFAHAYECTEGHSSEKAAEEKVFRDFNLKDVGLDGLPKYITDNKELYKDYFWSQT